jgi:prophage regulatory protein
MYWEAFMADDEHCAARFLNYRELSKLVPLSRQHIYRLEAAGEFPPHVKVGARGVVWFEPEVRAWMEARRSARKGEASPPR